jgi:hypothetical protein
MNVWVIYTYGPFSSHVTGVAKSLTSAIRLARGNNEQVEWDRLAKDCCDGAYLLSGKWRTPFCAPTHDGYRYVTHRITRYAI